MALLVTLKVVLFAAEAELCTGVKVPSAAWLAVLVLPSSIWTWVQQVVPNWIVSWLSRTGSAHVEEQPGALLQAAEEVS